MLSLSPYSSALTAKDAEHLLRRTMFGASRDHIRQLTGRTAAAAVDLLLADQPAPAPPIDPTTGQQWVTAAYNQQQEGIYFQALRSWWIGLMMANTISIREKMTLFWHNHFVSARGQVNDSRYMYAQNALLRRHALGNIKTLTREITYDPAMLRYLNGNTNRVGAAQENYARELQELFTIGKGPEIAPFNYTNYTEDDVRAAARVLTGWRDNPTTIQGFFTATLHDSTDKRFSAAYQNTVIRGRTGNNAGIDELNDLLDMIFRQAETARFLTRKLYRWFVNHDITPEVERAIIEPLAQTLRTGNFEVRPVLRTLLMSRHFFDPDMRGSIIKTPLDYVLGTLRQLDMTAPDPQTRRNEYYGGMNVLRSLAGQMTQDIMEHPNVAGWPAYYQEPLFYQIWITSATLPNRNNFINSVLNGIAPNFGGLVFAPGTRAFSFDSVDYASKFPNPEDPYKLIDNITEHFFAVDLTQKQKDKLLRDVLIPGLPDYEWTDEWTEWERETNTTLKTAKRNALKIKLDNLVRYMMGMAEFQIC